MSDWQSAALCRGNHSHLFFPPSTFERKDERERREIRAKAICQVCPVVGSFWTMRCGFANHMAFGEDSPNPIDVL